MHFFFCSYDDHRDLHSFPTRRSSDLGNSNNQQNPPAQVFNTAGNYNLQMVVKNAAGCADTTIQNLQVNALPVTGLITETRSEEHTSELQSQSNLVCRLLLEKK